jgi:hypothetical protein
MSKFARKRKTNCFLRILPSAHMWQSAQGERKLFLLPTPVLKTWEKEDCFEIPRQIKRGHLLSGRTLGTTEDFTNCNCVEPCEEEKTFRHY